MDYHSLDIWVIGIGKFGFGDFLFLFQDFFLDFVKHITRLLASIQERVFFEMCNLMVS